MSSIQSESTEFIPRCKCCLKDGSLKSLWADYSIIDGDFENYGEMITECFSLSWKPRMDSDDLICDSCIGRLRDSFNFKREVLASEQVALEIGLNKLKHETNDEDYDIELIEEADDEGTDIKTESMDDSDVEYQDVEYLEEEYHVEENSTLKHEEEPEMNRMKYTEESLKRCITAVTSKGMTKDEAARVYNIPRKVITNKIVRRGEKSVYLDPSKHTKFIEEVKTILYYTNVTPYRTKRCRLLCFYCGDRTDFEDSVELRNHTASEHSTDRLSIESIMRPQWSHEIIKLDISDLCCLHCQKPLTNWNSMFVHLQEVHGVKLELARRQAIPYLLGHDMQCGLCSQAFCNILQLDDHLNNHYSNYICSECGDGFVAHSKLKMHEKIHATEAIPCGQCAKAFALQKYRLKHIKYVHNQDYSFKCVYCPKKFQGDFARHAHVVECHKEKVKVITCEICGKSFDFRPYYTRHLRRKHSNTNQCKICKLAFDSKWELKHHQAEHRGEKLYFCKLCDKKYSSATTLSRHYSKLHGTVKSLRELEIETYKKYMDS